MASEFAAAGPNARDVLLFNMLPDLVEQITNTVGAIDIDKLTVIDGGGGSDSSNGVAGVAEQMPAAVISVVEQIENATGVNILDVFSKESAPESGDAALIVGQAEIAANGDTAADETPAVEQDS